MANDRTASAPRPPRVLLHKYTETQDEEIKIVASDGGIYPVDRNQVAAMCGNLQLPPSHEIQNTIQLPETSQVLKIMVQFLYNRPRPSLPRDLEISLALSVAEAGEKYEVFLLVDECCEFMERMKSTHPAHVLSYATRFNHVDLIDEKLVQDVHAQPLGTVAGMMHPSTLKIWVQYYDHTRRQLRYAVEMSRVLDESACSNWPRARAEFAERSLGDDFGELLSVAGMRSIMSACRCPGCDRAREVVCVGIKECTTRLRTDESFITG